MTRADGLRFLLDTNIIIGRLKRTPEVMELVDRLGFDFDNAAISQISRMELLSFPRLAGDEERQVRAFLDDCQVILCDVAIENAAIDLRRAHGLKLPDAIIVASASVNNLLLVTLARISHRRDEALSDLFCRIDGGNGAQMTGPPRGGRSAML